MVSQHRTAVVTVCTNRPRYAATMLQHLDAQDADLHIYVVLNSSNVKFCLGMVGYCSGLAKSVTLIRLWSMHTQIGLAFNCGLWHAMRDGYSHYVKIDDDVAIKPNGISELLRLCTEHKDRAVSVLLPWGRGGYYRWAHMKSRRVSRSNTYDRQVSDDYKYIYGACFMVPRQIHNEIGMYSEDGQRGMDLDFAVRVQRAGNTIVEHGALRALHLGNTTPTEGDKETRKSKKYCKFGALQKRSTIWNEPAVRQSLIAQVFGAKDRAQAERP